MPPVPPPSLPAATSQAISTASSQQAPEFTAARGLAQAGRVHKRESEAGGLDEQPRKKPRANKWDQQEPDLPTSDASPASQVLLTDVSWTLCWMVSGHLTFGGPILQGSGQDAKCLSMKEALYTCIGPCLCVLQTAHMHQVYLADNRTLCVVWLPYTHFSLDQTVTRPSAPQQLCLAFDLILGHTQCCCAACLCPALIFGQHCFNVMISTAAPYKIFVKVLQAGAKGQHPTQHAMEHAPSPPPPLPLQSPTPFKPIIPEAAAAAVPAHLLPPHLTGLSHRPDHGQPQTQHAPGPVPQADLRHVAQKTVRHAVPVAVPQRTGPQSDPHQLKQLSGLQGAAAAAAAEAAKPPPSLPVAWHGHLAKTGVPKCRAECLSIGPADALLPWPKLLDVRARVVVARALEQSKAHAPQNMVIRCIVSTDDTGNSLQFHDFCEYLTEKQRAGVVNFKSSSNKHTMFLIPGCQDVYQQLHVRHPRQECLVAVILK